MTESEKKHGFRNSGYERRPNEQYFTENWCTRALLKHAPLDRLKERPVWEPAAGRGDITRILQESHIDVANSDLDVSNFDSDLGSITAQNFLETEFSLETAEDYSGIITNPPYGGKKVLYEGRKMPIAEAFLRHALYHEIEFVAMLLRTDFNHSKFRADLFSKYPFAYEIVLTSRPRWDWWYADTMDPWERKSPMHNFSWFCFDRRHVGPSTQYFVNRNDVSLPDEPTDDEEETDDE